MVMPLHLLEYSPQNLFNIISLHYVVLGHDYTILAHRYI